MSLVQIVDSLSRPAISPVGFPSNEIPAALSDHLRQRLGVWPPSRPLDAIVWPGRDLPEWDGGHWLLLGLTTPTGTVLSIAPELGVVPAALDLARIELALRSPDSSALGAVLGQQGLRRGTAIFRWSTAPAQGPDSGTWLASTDSRLPDWLRPFGGESLVVWGETGEVAGVVGLKRHDRLGSELSVAVEPAHRGRGLARALVAQAGQRVLANGGVPIYLHEASNVASAHVADAAGFPDRGWRLTWLSPACPDAVSDHRDDESYRVQATPEGFQS